MPFVRQSRSLHRSSRAFTIIELLVAAAITIVLVGLMLTITTGVLDTWSRSTGRLAAHNQAKLALDILARDLQSLVLKKDGNVWLAASIQDDQTSNTFAGDAGPATATTWNPSYAVPAAGVGKPLANDANAPSLQLVPASRKLEDYRFGHAGVWLRFFTRQPAKMESASINVGNVHDISAPRAVGYQIARMPVQSGLSSNTAPENFPDLRWALFRTQVRPTAFTTSNIASSNRSTLAVGYNIVADEYQDATGAGGGGNSGDPGVIRRPSKFSDLLAENIIDFGLRVYERNINGDLVLVFPSDNTFTPASRAWCYLATNPDAPAPLPTPAAPYNNSGLANVPAGIVRGQPAAFELFVRVLTAEGVNRLQALELGRVDVPAGLTGSEYWWEIAVQNSVTFTRRVDLPIQAR